MARRLAWWREEGDEPFFALRNAASDHAYYAHRDTGDGFATDLHLRTTREDVRDFVRFNNVTLED
jgi:hypothetical protein